MALVTIISPIYNVEEYLRKGIQSILAQSFTDFEYYAVDDGSTDKSAEICDEYAQIDNRVHVIHQKNQGSSVARNAGLENASGKYIYFIDADDWIEKDRLKNMVDLAEKNEADLVVTGFKMEYYLDGKDITYETTCPDKSYASIQDFRYDAYNYLNNSLLSLPWNKLFLRKHIEEENIRFQKTKWPDHHFCMDYLMNCKCVVLSSATDYHWYRSRKGSATMITYADIKMFDKRFEHYQHIIKLYKHWGINDETSMDAINSYFIGRVVQCVQELADNEELSIGERRNRIKKIITHPTVKKAMKHAKSMSTLMKLMSIPISMQSVSLCIFFGKTESRVRKAFPNLFIRLKEKEVHGA